jgi:hypothetical protein
MSDIIEEAKRFISKDSGDNYHNLQKVIFKRLYFIKKTKFADSSMVELDQEYISLMESVVAMDNHYTNFKNQISSIDNLGKLFKQAMQFDNDLANWMHYHYDVTLAAVNRRLLQVQQENEKWVVKYIEDYNNNPNTRKKYNWRSYLTDRSNDLFEPLYKKSKAVKLDKKNNIIRDDKGNIVYHDVITGEIHWNPKDPETRKAIDDGIITEEQVEYGTRVMDLIERLFIESIKRNRPNASEPMTDAEAMEQLENRWIKGQLAAMPQTIGQALSKGILKKENRKNILQAWMRRMGTVESSFQDHYISELDNSDLMISMLAQFHDKNVLGSARRRRFLGLSNFNDGTNEYLVLNDENANKGMNLNIQHVFNYTAGSEIRIQEFKTRLLQRLEVAHDLMHAYGKIYGRDEDANNWKELFEGMKQLVVHNQVEKVGNIIISNERSVNADNVVYAAGAAASLTFLGFKLGSAIKNLFSLNIEIINRSIANSISGNNFFTPLATLKAYGKMKTEWDKVKAVNRMLQVAAMDEKSIMRSYVNNSTARGVGAAPFLGLFIGDMGARLVVMVAQMITEGSWDAYVYNKDTDSLTYDPKKDKRFAKDGKITEDGQKILDVIRQNMIREGIQDPEKKELAAGHDIVSRNNMSYIADKYITGSYKNEQKTMVSSKLWGYAMMMFQNWAIVKKNQWFERPGGEKGKGKLGRWEVIDGEVKYVEPATEGIAWTLLHIGLTLAKYKHKSWNEMKLTKHQKNNLAKMMLDLAALASIKVLLSSLFGFYDDEDPRHDENKNKILLRALDGARREVMANVDPVTLVKQSLGQTIPIVSLGQNLYNLLAQSLDLHDERYYEKLGYQASRTLPFGGTVNEVKIMFRPFFDDETIEQTYNMID